MIETLINGYGIRITGKVFDINKVEKELNIDIGKYKGVNNPFEYLSDMEPGDIFEELLNKVDFMWHRQYIQIGDNFNHNKEIFLFYSPNYPWLMIDRERYSRKDDINSMFIDILTRVTNLREDEIVKNLKTFSAICKG